MAVTERNYIVKGMSCDHCKASVSEEVEGVAGVTDVEVELGTGRLTVRGENLSDDAVGAAVEAAGYEVVRS